MRPAVLANVGVLVAFSTLGCAAESPETSEITAPVVYGADDRLEFFEVELGDARARIAESVVALVPKARILATDTGIALDTPALGETEALCPGERFAEQPAAAFCTGVLLDWDLVLTAGHCARALAVADFVVLFDYFYAAPGELALGRASIAEPLEFVSEALDPPGSTPRLDYAWLRLREPVNPPRRPAALRLEPPTLGDSVLSATAVGGGPIKLDAGGTIRDLREPQHDYFVADSDTSEGSSGGPAFDRDLVLLGVLARGGPDLVPTSAGCNENLHELGESAEEHFTYAARALEGLCAAGSASSLCRRNCSTPCSASPRKLDLEGAPKPSGCSIAVILSSSGASSSALLMSLSLALFRRRRRRLVGIPRLCRDSAV